MHSAGQRRLRPRRDVCAHEVACGVARLLRAALGEVTEKASGGVVPGREQFACLRLDLLGLGVPARLQLVEAGPHDRLALGVAPGVVVALGPVEQRLEPPPR